jgi:hypothetical protein
LVALPKSIISHISFYSKTLRRLFRTDVRLGIKLSETTLLIVLNKSFYEIDIIKKSVEKSADIPIGSRPLNIVKIKDLESFEDGHFFGEYFSNPEMGGVSIYKYINRDLEKVYSFESKEINHIHNLIPDPFRNCVWILTGDFNKGAAIFKATNNFKNVEPIVRGKQEYRSCVAFPVKEGLIYATDSQFQENSIRLLSESETNKWESKKIFAMNGPAIFGTKNKDTLIMSTSVEAINKGTLIQKLLRRKSGPGIIKDQSEIIIGNLIKGFSMVYNNKKDFLPFVLFQFGNIIFPTGQNDTDFLVYYTVGLRRNDLSTEILHLNEI